MDEVIQQSPIPQQTPTQPKMPPENSNSNWLRTLAIGFGIVSIGTAIAAGGYFLGTKNSQPPIKTVTVSPSPTTVDTRTQFIDQKQISETVNWNVYVDPQNIFSVKYPPTFTITKNESDQAKPFIVSIKDDTLEVVISLEQSNLSLVDYLKETTKNLGGITIVKILTNEFMIPWEKTDNSKPIPLGMTIDEYYIKRGINIINIHASSPIFPGDSLTVFNQILSTFRFAN